MCFATPIEFAGMSLKVKETNISNKHHRLKNHNFTWCANELSVLACDQVNMQQNIGNTSY